jgi:hypothetical protein
MNRKLASIQKIVNIHNIEGADKIETVQVLGWECVSRKNEFKVGDLVVYCEVDSILPEKPEFEFLRDRKFRIKTIKLRKQISQGIVFPLSILPNPFNHTEGEDVTEILGIVKHDPQLQEEKALAEQFKSKSKINKFFMNFALYRYIYFKFNHKDKGWPNWIPHTDEERIQSCVRMLINRPNSEWYITEKLDGQSGTFFIGNKKTWGIKKLEFGVCSRNIRLSKPDNSSYWAMAEKYDIKKKLLELEEAGIVVQGECVGQKIQKNKYGLEEQDFFVFNVIDNGTKYTLGQMKVFCLQNGFKTVPIINESWTFNNCDRPVSEIIKELVTMSIDKSVLNKDIWREGIVLRLKEDPNVSFKVINPEFLLKYSE